MNRGLAAWVVFAALVPAVAQAQTPENPQEKIGFDLTAIAATSEAMTDKAALAYEFCLPNERSVIQAVQAIDPTVILYLEGLSPTRCAAGEILAIGNIQQDHPTEVLLRLAALEEIVRIEPWRSE